MNVIPLRWMPVAVALAMCSASRVSAHTDSPGSLPLTPYTLRLQHRSPSEIIALFGREQLPIPGGHEPRAARIDSPESLLPDGTQALYRTPIAGELVVVATENSAEVEACIRQLDVPLQTLGPDRVKVSLILRHAPATKIRAAVLRLPGVGGATTSGQQLTLTGSAAWVHRALRCVIRAEFGITELPATPAR